MGGGWIRVGGVGIVPVRPGCVSRTRRKGPVATAARATRSQSGLGSRFRSSIAARSTRTSESKGNQQIYDSSAPFEPKLANGFAPKACELRVRGTRLTRSQLGRYGSGAAARRTFDLSAIPRQCIEHLLGLGMTRQLPIYTARGLVMVSRSGAKTGTPTEVLSSPSAPARQHFGAVPD